MMTGNEIFSKMFIEGGNPITDEPFPKINSQT
jgi:hypothetical protein